MNIKFNLTTRHEDRIYTKNQFVGKAVQEQIKSHKLLACCGGNAGVNIDLTTVCGEITEMYEDEETGEIYGTVSLMQSPMGKIIQELIQYDKIKFDVVPRGVGKIDIDGNVTDYKLICLDMVLKNDR